LYPPYQQRQRVIHLSVTGKANALLESCKVLQTCVALPIRQISTERTQTRAARVMFVNHASRQKRMAQHNRLANRI
jgi:hypothetical protein